MAADGTHADERTAVLSLGDLIDRDSAAVRLQVPSSVVADLAEPDHLIYHAGARIPAWTEDALVA